MNFVETEIDEMYVWFIHDVVEALEKNRDSVLMSLRSGDGLIEICTRKGYRYEVCEHDFAAHSDLLAVKMTG